MTLLPSSDYRIRGHPGNAYDVNEQCAHPHCTRPSAHAHHLWRRSHLRGQPYEWVKLPDGTVIGNRLGFCVEHHDMLTGPIGGYRARLSFENGLFYWLHREANSFGYANPWSEAGPNPWSEACPLKWQPPAAGQDLPWAQHTHGSAEEEEQCPTCGHVKRKSARAEAKPGKLRPTKQYVMAVPDDAEDGAEIMDGHVDDWAIVFGIDHYTSRHKRYLVFNLLLAACAQLRPEIIKLVAEAAGRRVSSG